jgi:hypothetical protein
MVIKTEWLKCTFPLRVFYSKSVHYVVAARWVRKLTYSRSQVLSLLLMRKGNLSLALA